MVAVVFVMAIWTQIAQANWLYRRAITVSSTGTELTNYQVLVTLTNDNFSYGNSEEDDGRDLRFTTLGCYDDPNVDYWIEEWIEGGTSKVWIEVPSIPASGGTTVYMYYGNSSASSASNGDATFDIFEDFDNNDGEWTEYDPNNKVELDYTTDHRLEFNNWIRSDPGYVYKFYSMQNFVEEYDINITGHGGNGKLVGPGFSDNLCHLTETQNGIFSVFYAGWPGGGGVPHIDPQIWEDGTQILDWEDYLIPISTGTIYYVRFEKFGDSVKLSVFSDASRTTHISGSPKTATTNLSATTFNYYYAATGSVSADWEWTTGWIDNIKVRKYASSEPTVTVGGEEEAGEEDWSLPVQLSAFTATASADGVILNWRTESEVNNVGFAIHRSDVKDGQYAKIGWMNGAGNSAMPHDYQFLDKQVESGKTYFYYIEDVDIAGERNRSDIIQITVTPRPQAVIPTKFALLQNYPNPFNPETWVPYQLAKDVHVAIIIHNARGQTIRILDLGAKQAGEYIVRTKAAKWDGRDDLGEKVASGVYFYTLKAGEFSATQKMIIIE